MIFCRIYGLVLERSDTSFQQCTMPHDTTAENGNTRSNTAEIAEISSHWKTAEIADSPSRWKFGAVWTEKRRRYRGDTAAALYPACFFFRGPLGLEMGLRFTPLRK